METHLSLEVRLSCFISAAVDDSAPLTRQGVIELVREFMTRPEMLEHDALFGNLIDHVRAEAISDPSGLELSAVPAGQVELDVFGPWCLDEVAGDPAPR